MFHVTAVLNWNSFDIHLIPITFIKNCLSTTAINPVVNSLSFFDNRHLKKLTKKQTLPLLCASPISDKYSKLHSQMKTVRKINRFFSQFLHWNTYTLKDESRNFQMRGLRMCKIRRHTVEVRLYWSAKTGQPLSLNGLCGSK